MKRCNKCARILEETEFYKDKYAYDRLHKTCKDCDKAYSKYYYSNNTERRKKAIKRYYEKKKKASKI